MCRIDDDDIAAGIEQSFRPCDAVFADSCRGGDPKTTLLIFAGIWVTLCLLDILDRDEADTLAISSITINFRSDAYAGASLPRAPHLQET